jgi:bloom syndrome protein
MSVARFAVGLAILRGQSEITRSARQAKHVNSVCNETRDRRTCCEDSPFNAHGAPAAEPVFLDVFMTRNNLGEHLSWLLGNIALSRPNAPSLPAAHDLPVDLSIPDLSTPISLPSQPDTRHSATFGISSATGNLNRQTLPHAAAHVAAAPNPPTHPPERLDDGCIARSPGGKMGRLASNSSTKKRSLLLQQEQSQDQLLTPDSTSATPGRLQKAYAASLRTPGTNASASAKDLPQKRPQRLVARTPDLHEDQDCETVDLTGSDELLSSESNGFAFGGNVTIWTADHAGRPEPLSERRGKKRKSGDISRLHQPEPAVDPFDEEFPDIFDIVGDTSIESIVRTTPKSSRKRKAVQEESQDAVFRESTERRSTGLTKVPPSGTKRSPTKAILKRAPSESPSIPARRTPSPVKRRSPVKLKEEKEVEASPDPRVSLPRTRRDSRVIQDSDEEWATPPTHNVSIVTAHSSTSRGDQRHSSPHHVREKSPAIIAFDTPFKPRKYKSTASPTDLSPVKKMSDSQPGASAEGLVLGNASAPVASQTPTPSQLIPSLSDDVKAAILKLFLSRPSILQYHRSTVEDKLTQNRTEFRTALTSGQLGQTNTLKCEKDRLTAQLAALNVLSDEHQSYEYLVLEKDILVEQMMEAYDQDMDAEASNKRLEELVAEVSERETTLVTTLLKAGINDVTMFEERKPTATHMGRTEPIVQATQHSYRPPSHGLPGVSTQEMSHSTQIIMQTQISQRHQFASDSAFRTADDAPFPRSGGREKGKATSSVPRSVGGSSSAYKNAPPAKDIIQSRSTPTMDEDLYDFGGEEEIFGYEPSPEIHRSIPQSAREPSSMRGCKTPASISRHTDTFMSEDDYDDDADMLELAHDFELKQSSSESIAQRQGRSVFAETSGNSGSSKSSKTAKRAPSTSSKSHFPPALMEHPWSADVKRALKDRFRMVGFRHNQLEAINTTLAGMDAFVLMPTGGGKSLCYQLPAVVKSGKTRGITIVVSPLLSLMQDQVDHLMALHIQAVSFNGECSKEARQKLLQLLRDPSADHYIDLLYVTPEMINKSAAFLNALRSLYQNKKLARLVIDEAHCVSQWGHDFRPDYKEIGAFRNDFPDVPLMALTATATPNVIVDVKHNLGIDRCQLFSQSFNRPNLYYEVRWKEKGVVDTIAELILSKYHRQTGIVYTLSRKNAESTAQKLQEHGIAAHHYHAGMEPAQKEQVQKDWQKDKIRVVVATIAFGMGIDKPDVRFVIHQTLPKSLEGYYQETGRAGRDGQPSECYLFYNYGDITQLRKMISDGEGSFEQKERQRNMLNAVAAFADNRSDCRRVEILRYFGEAFRKVDCQATCDNCKTNGTFEMRDFTSVAVAALGIIRSENHLTMNQCTEALQGLNKKKYMEASATEYFGSAKKLQKHEIQRVIDKLAAEGALEEKNIFNKHSKIAVQYFTVSCGVPVSHVPVWY